MPKISMDPKYRPEECVAPDAEAKDGIGFCAFKRGSIRATDGKCAVIIPVKVLAGQDNDFQPIPEEALKAARALAKKTDKPLHLDLNWNEAATDDGQKFPRLPVCEFPEFRAIIADTERTNPNEVIACIKFDPRELIKLANALGAKTGVLMKLRFAYERVRVQNGVTWCAPTSLPARVTAADAKDDEEAFGLLGMEE